MLEVSKLSVSYGKTQVLWSVDLTVQPSEVVAIMGPNGSGKSTVFKAITGLAKVSDGSITFEGRDIANAPPHIMAKLGISLVMERRRLFPRMTVTENVLLGAYAERAPKVVAARFDRLAELFPILKQQAGAPASSLSGGQQQMVAIARGLMSEPRLVIMDEPFLGLSPEMVSQTMQVINGLSGRGVAVLFNEQNARTSFSNAHRGYLLESGRVVVTGSGLEMLEHPSVRSAYLGY